VTVTGATCDSNNLEMQEISPLLMRLSSNAGSGSEEKTEKNSVGETISGSMVIYKNLTTELWN
jgi:hypothetical protein